MKIYRKLEECKNKRNKERILLVKHKNENKNKKQYEKFKQNRI